MLTCEIKNSKINISESIRTFEINQNSHASPKLLEE